MKKYLLLFALIYQSTAFALPFAELKVFHHENRDGSHTYFIAQIKNTGPIAENIATKPDHGVFDWNTQTFYPAGGISLNDDENIFQFGVDTLRDDIVITHFTNGKVKRNNADTVQPSPFSGVTMDGFDDGDGDGIPNKIVMWNLSEGVPMNSALQIGDVMKWVSFTTDSKLGQFNIWVQGSDDEIVWGAYNELTLHGEHGHYNATTGAYLSVILERGVTAKALPRRHLRRVFSQ